MDNYFEALRAIDVSQYIEKKPKKTKTGQTVNLSFLSWANAWGQLKMMHPDATFRVYENDAQWNYFTDGRTAWVKVGVTVNGIEHVETLPVYDNRFASIPLESITSDHVNTAIQRCLAKAIALHGLGLGLYAGEDLNEKDDDLPFTFNEGKPTKPMVCDGCGAMITEAEFNYSTSKMGRPLCRICQRSEH